MEKYGLTKYQIKQADKKLKNNIKFMLDNGIQLDNKIVPYAEFVQNSYINADRYIAEIQHRAWNMYDYACKRDLVNMMFSLTLGSEWHPKKTVKGKLVRNPKFAGRKFITTINGYDFFNCEVKQDIPFIEPILDFSNTVDKYTPRNASKELSKMLKKFFDDRAYKNIDVRNRCYFRVTEPHKDGTPHVHMSLFVPKENQEKIIAALERLYPAPLGQIETDIKKPVSYLMKYVLKTLDDLRESNDISNLTRWYLYHGINRFYTSRTFINLEIYRKLKGAYNIADLSEKYANGDLNVYTYSDTKKIALIENEHGTLYVPKPINWEDKEEQYTEVQYNKLFVKSSNQFVSPIRKQNYFESVYTKEELDFEREYINGKTYSVVDGEYIECRKEFYEYSDIQLEHYFNEIHNKDNTNPQHYDYIKKLLEQRGVFERPYVDFNLESEVF